MMAVLNNVAQPSVTPGIVTDNLQLYLDAADPASYPGSGTTWTDLSPNAYSTTLVGSPTFNSTYFNFGNNQYVDTNQALSAESFSVGAWIRSSATGIRMFLSKETPVTGNPWNYRMWLNSGTLIGDMSQVTTQSSLQHAGGYNNGQWYLAMFTRDDSNWYLYVNGSQVATKADPYTGSVTNPQELWIGRSAYTGGGGYQFLGDIGQVFIYNAVLTPAEISQNYNATKATYGL